MWLVSDTLVDVGTVTTDQLMGAVNSDCGEGVGVCTNAPLSYSGTYIPNNATRGTPVSETVSLTINGDYPPWMHSALIDGLSAALGKVSYASDETSSQHQTPDGDCHPGTSCVTDTSKPITINSVPAAWAIQYLDPNDKYPAPMYISVSVSQQATASGVCSTLFSTAAGIAGAFGAEGSVAGAGFTLLNLACLG